MGEGLLLTAGPAISPGPVPTVFSVAAGASGTPNGTYLCCVTFVTAAGETLPSAEVQVVVSSQKISWSGIPVSSGLSGVTARKLYRTAAGGAAGTEKLVATIADNTTTTYTDNVADGSLGAAVPTVDTSAVPTGVSRGSSITSAYELSANKGKPSGYGSLDPTGHETSGEIPLTVANVASAYAASQLQIVVPIVADNSTDNSTAIQAAIDTATAAGGGEVKLQVASGTTGIAKARWVSKPHVIVRGPGARTLTIKAPSGSSDVVSGLNFATLTGKSYATGDYLLGAPESGVIGLTLDGNATANFGYRVWGRALITDDLIVQNCAAGGLWTEFTSVDNFLDPAQKLEGSFGTIKSIANTGDGWTMRGPHDSTCDDFCSYNNTGWAFTVDGVNGSGGYLGGCTFAHFNSFLNGTGSLQQLGIGFFDILSGAVSAANVGTGIELSTVSGQCRARVTVAGHTIGIHLRGTAHRFDITGATNNPGDVIKVDGCQKCYVSIGGGSVNNNVFNVVSEGGPNFFEGVIDISTGKTFQTGSAWNSATTVIFTANGTGGSFSTVKLPVSAMLLSNGWTPILPPSNNQLEVEGFVGETYSTSITINAANALPTRYITVTNGTAFTLNAPTNLRSGQLLTVLIDNESGGAMGAITWNGVFRLAGAFTNPANTKIRTVTFRYAGGSLVEICRSAADL